jgi:hypothetical protein
MSAYTTENTPNTEYTASSYVADAEHGRTTTGETKPSLKTTELLAYIVVAIAVLIAAAVTDNGSDGQGFSADHAWFYVTLLTIGYMVSRGLAKSGSYSKDGSQDKATRR